MSKVYVRGENVRQIAEVTDSTGAYLDPDSIVITIIDSEGSTQVDAQSMSKSDTGKYYFDFVIPVSAPCGDYKSEIKAVKGFTAIEQDHFTVVNC